MSETPPQPRKRLPVPLVLTAFVIGVALVIAAAFGMNYMMKPADNSSNPSAADATSTQAPSGPNQEAGGASTDSPSVPYEDPNYGPGNPSGSSYQPTNATSLNEATSAFMKKFTDGTKNRDIWLDGLSDTTTSNGQAQVTKFDRNLVNGKKYDTTYVFLGGSSDSEQAYVIVHMDDRSLGLTLSPDSSTDEAGTASTTIWKVDSVYSAPKNATSFEQVWMQPSVLAQQGN